VRGVAARQQRLAASIDWSHELLATDERQVFRRLAVFAGGFTLDAARAVCGRGGVLEIFGRLVDKSLVVAEAGRYRLLETIHQYAGDRLREADELEEVRDLHLDHYLAAAEAAEPLLDSDRDMWRAVIEPDRENYRPAVEHGLSAPDPDRGRRLAAALPWMWNLQATGSEGIRILRRAIDAAPGTTRPAADSSSRPSSVRTGSGRCCSPWLPQSRAVPGLSAATTLSTARSRSSAGRTDFLRWLDLRRA